MSDNSNVEKWTKEECVKFLRTVKGAKLTGNKCELICRVKSYIQHPDILNHRNNSYFYVLNTYESRFRGGILLLGFLLCPTAQRKSQTSMKILISGFNVCANAHGSSREDIFKTIN